MHLMKYSNLLAQGGEQSRWSSQSRAQMIRSGPTSLSCVLSFFSSVAFNLTSSFILATKILPQSSRYYPGESHIEGRKLTVSQAFKQKSWNLKQKSQLWLPDLRQVHFPESAVAEDGLCGLVYPKAYPPLNHSPRVDRLVQVGGCQKQNGHFIANGEDNECWRDIKKGKKEGKDSERKEGREGRKEEKGKWEREKKRGREGGKIECSPLRQWCVSKCLTHSSEKTKPNKKQRKEKHKANKQNRKASISL